MRAFLENLFSVSILVGTEAWFLDGYFSGTPEYEPAIAFIAALAVILGKDSVRAQLSKKPEVRVHDRELFERFLNMLPPSQTSRFFKEHDFGGSFARAEVENIYRFADTWKSVENEFLDPELESENKKLYETAFELAQEISGRTVPLKESSLASVYSDNQRASGGARPASVIEDAKVINLKASEFVAVYEAFVRLCRTKLSANL
jgi:hypothetical protein